MESNIRNDIWGIGNEWNAESFVGTLDGFSKNAVDKVLDFHRRHPEKRKPPGFFTIDPGVYVIIREVITLRVHFQIT